MLLIIKKLIILFLFTIVLITSFKIIITVIISHHHNLVNILYYLSDSLLNLPQDIRYQYNILIILNLELTLQNLFLVSNLLYPLK